MGELTIAELDAEICSLAARINVATARLLLLVGEFDELEGWAGYGVKSCAHWLSAEVPARRARRAAGTHRRRVAAGGDPR